MRKARSRRLRGAWALTLACGLTACGGPPWDLREERGSFRPVLNRPWRYYGHDFGRVPTWTWSGASQDATLDQDFAYLARAGVEMVVWFLLGDGRASPEFDQNGRVTGFDAEFWQDYDQVVRAAGKHKVPVLWVLLDFKAFEPRRVVYDPLLEPGEGKGIALFGHADLVEDDAKRQSFLEVALRPLVRRHPRGAGIAGWVVVNEPENAIKEGYVSASSLTRFVDECSRVIREETSRQPVSVAALDLESLLEYWDRDSLDFLVFHHRGRAYPPPPLRQVGALLRSSPSKPIYIGEFDRESLPARPLPEFVQAARDLGYAGAWLWPPEADSTRPLTAGPRGFALLEEYVSAHGAPSVQPSAQPPVRGRVEERLTESRRLASEAAQSCPENVEWEERARDELAAKRAELANREEMRERVNKDLVVNTEFLHKKTAEQKQLQHDIETMQHDLALASPLPQGKTTAAISTAQAYLAKAGADAAVAAQNLEQAKAGLEPLRQHTERVQLEIQKQEGDYGTAHRRAELHLAQKAWHEMQVRQGARLYGPEERGRLSRPSGDEPRRVAIGEAFEQRLAQASQRRGVAPFEGLAQSEVFEGYGQAYEALPAKLRTMPSDQALAVLRTQLARRREENAAIQGVQTLLFRTLAENRCREAPAPPPTGP